MPEPSSPDEASVSQIPQALVRPRGEAAVRRWRTRMWWLTALCIVLALALSASALRSPGRKIVVHFSEGHGIKPGDALRYRGIDIGSVVEVRLAADMQRVDLAILLAPEHAAVAVEGSRFWIQRPRIRIGQMSGLETVIGAKYVGILPGALQGKIQSEFTGLENPLSHAEQDSTEIRVHFPNGEGLTPGDPVRYLGIDAGEVVQVELAEQMSSVLVTIRLLGTAQQLAREGTQFWVERPRLDISEIRGLDTLIGGRYIALEPGAGASPQATEFVGLSQAPPLTRREGSLELELEAQQRYGLVRGAPLTYRGLEVGRVADVSLATDGASVMVRVIVEPEYTDLVRSNSVWWSTGGVKLDAKLTGVEISIDSFTAWLRGGVSFATPDPPGEKIATGYRFGLAAKPQEQWLAWQPHIATGPWAAQGDQRPLPQVSRIAASWQSTFLGFSRRQSVQTWCLPIEGNTAWVSASFLKASAGTNSPVTLEIGGRSTSLLRPEVDADAALAVVSLPSKLDLPMWPKSAIAQQSWNGKSPLLIVNPELKEPLPLDGSRAAITSSGKIEINPTMPIHQSLEGSAVIDTATGELLGLLVSLNNRWVIAAPPNPSPSP